VVFSF